MGRTRSITNEDDWTAKHYIRVFGKTRFTKREIVANRDFALAQVRIMEAYWYWQWDNDIENAKETFARRSHIPQAAIDYMHNFFDKTLAMLDMDDTIEMSTSGGDGVEVGVDEIRVRSKETE